MLASYAPYPPWLNPGDNAWQLTAATLVGTPLTGAALNPARWFGTVIWEMSIESLQAQGPFRDQVIFWFGPIAGALLAGLVYTTVLLPEAEGHGHGHGPAPATKAHAGAAPTLFRSKK